MKHAADGIVILLERKTMSNSVLCITKSQKEHDAHWLKWSSHEVTPRK